MTATCRSPAVRRASRRSPRGRCGTTSPRTRWTAWTAVATSFGITSLAVGALGPLAPAAWGGPLVDPECFLFLALGATAIGLGTPLPRQRR